MREIGPNHFVACHFPLGGPRPSNNGAARATSGPTPAPAAPGASVPPPSAPPSAEPNS